jgi:hypothetical protein
LKLNLQLKWKAPNTSENLDSFRDKKYYNR